MPAGTYSLKVATRTTYSDNGTFCVDVTLENPSDKVDVDWEQMTIDLRGHALRNSWNSAIAGSTGDRHGHTHSGHQTVTGAQQDVVRLVRAAQRRKVEGALPGAGQDAALVRASRTHRWCLSLHGRRVMATSLYTRGHHFPNTHSITAA